MNCEAITRFRNWVPKESKWVEPTEEEWAARIAAVAEGMKRLMKDLDDGKFG
ncbi:MAG: hypothetical protein LBC20_04685 [Planctomycetaceae bacterium]|nr:hypothetical protein [Planctomycetaceae bacterium]